MDPIYNWRCEQVIYIVQQCCQTRLLTHAGTATVTLKRKSSILADQFRQEQGQKGIHFSSFSPKNINCIKGKTFCSLQRLHTTLTSGKIDLDVTTRNHTNNHISPAI
jgi:hypothetical protein